MKLFIFTLTSIVSVVASGMMYTSAQAVTWYDKPPAEGQYVPLPEEPLIPSKDFERTNAVPSAEGEEAESNESETSTNGAENPTASQSESETGNASVPPTRDRWFIWVLSVIAVGAVLFVISRLVRRS